MWYNSERKRNICITKYLTLINVRCLYRKGTGWWAEDKLLRPNFRFSLCRLMTLHKQLELNEPRIADYDNILIRSAFTKSFLIFQNQRSVLMQPVKILSHQLNVKILMITLFITVLVLVRGKGWTMWQDEQTFGWLEIVFED